MDKLGLRSSATGFLVQEVRLLLTFEGKKNPTQTTKTKTHQTKHLVGYDALCSFTQQSRATKLPEMLCKIILIPLCLWTEEHSQWERQRRRWDASEALSGESWDGKGKEMKDISAVL